jgi:branched-chain amino acid transport system permease protein
VTIAALIHVVVSGLATGSIYALMALSLVIIDNAIRTLNFAQGAMSSGSRSCWWSTTWTW